MKLSGELLAVLSAVFIGMAIPLGAQASKEIGAFQMATYSCLFSAVFLLVLSVVAKERIQARTYLKKYPKEAFLNIITRTVIGSFLYFYGVGITTAIHAAFMMRLEPIFVAILGYAFLRESIKPKQIAFLLIMIFGAFLYSTGGSTSLGQAQFGDLVVILSVLFFACSYIPMKKVGDEINSLTITTVNNFIGGLILLIFVPFISFNLFTVNLSNVWLMLGYVITFYVFGLYLYFSSIRKTKMWIVSSLLSLSSVIGALLSYLFLGETLNAIQLVGGVIILLTSYLIARK